MSISLPAAAVPATCSCCTEEDHPADGVSGRYKLWELDSGTHCSVIGTCLNLDELRKIIRKIDLALAADAHDYDIHGYFVTQASGRSAVSKLLHKTLDRKYAAQIVRFRRAGSPEELWELWRQAVGNGDVSGAYWALLTHKTTPRAMSIRAHNEVHMLSHLMGKSSRDDIRRLRQLETSCAELAERLAKTRARADTILQERDSRIRDLEGQLSRTRATPDKTYLEIAARVVRKRDAELDRLRARFVTLERHIKTERARARIAEDKLRMVSTGHDIALNRESPSPSLETTVIPHEDQGDLDLQGCALLYVGGHPNVTPHLRAHVERMHGTFLHHDGGIETQTGKLPGLVSQVDAVFCPIGCVSHDACLRLKHLCKRHGKRFVLLRSAGLSGFASAVSRLAASQTSHDEAARL